MFNISICASTSGLSAGFFPHKNLAMAAGSSHDFMEGGTLPVSLTLADLINY